MCAPGCAHFIWSWESWKSCCPAFRGLLKPYKSFPEFHPPPHPDQFFMGNIFCFIHFFYFPNKKTENFVFFENLGGKFTARPIFNLNLRPTYPRISIPMHKTNFVALVLRIIKHSKMFGKCIIHNETTSKTVKMKKSRKLKVAERHSCNQIFSFFLMYLLWYMYHFR